MSVHARLDPLHPLVWQQYIPLATMPVRHHPYQRFTRWSPLYILTSPKTIRSQFIFLTDADFIGLNNFPPPVEQSSLQGRAACARTRLPGALGGREMGVSRRPLHAALSIPHEAIVTCWKNPILQGRDIGAGHSAYRTQRYDLTAGSGNIPRPQVSPAASNTGHQF
jgi:hypothetical protein